MKQIKFIILLIFLPFFLSTTALCQSDKSRLKLVARLIGTYDLNIEDNCNYFQVEIQLINHTDSLLTFTAFSCLTSFNIITDSNEIFICPNQCATNFPTNFKIKPNQIFSIPLIIKVNKNYLVRNKPVRFGLIFLQLKEFEEFIEVIQVKRERFENVIWSNTLDLIIGTGEPAKICSIKV